MPLSAPGSPDDNDYAEDQEEAAAAEAAAVEEEEEEAEEEGVEGGGDGPDLESYPVPERLRAGVPGGLSPDRPRPPRSSATR